MMILKWLDVQYADGYDKLISMKNGKHASFSRMKVEGEDYLLKVYHNCTDGKIRVIDRFRDLSYDGVHAFPVGNVYVYGRNEGYVSKEYTDALDFSDEGCSDVFPYSLKYQATLDVSSQLRFLHENGFIVNDIRLTNNLISFHYQHGMMIDFENMILEGDHQNPASYYKLYEYNYREALPPSKWEDVKKQFLCNTSLLLNQNFEYFVICHGFADLADNFTFDKDIYDFAKTLFYTDEILYFDEIAPKFQDEEKIKYYIKK